MDTGIPLFFSEIEYLLLETIPLETIMRVYVILLQGYLLYYQGCTGKITHLLTLPTHNLSLYFLNFQIIARFAQKT